MYAFSNGNFYPLSMREVYEASDSWPIEYIEVGESVFTEFSASPPVGKIRGTGDNGMPAWVDIPLPTQEEIVAEAELKKANLRVLADSEIDWRQDAVDAGIATEEETAALSEWKKYRVLLMRVDTAKPVWPTPPGEQAR
ncbi:tail fiber assembly protein [Citrobacter braakii]|uniref:Phage tail protein n=1 Tax=Citrobacter braakii TaxID=57706 RepID=A0A1V8NR54_CITBR|nr:tail fiber assembly protein [Citrobacter braakii]OQM38896.1 phage tail protein [Citrobacter braakii]QXC17308.1 tail fiber assembly protein [Citrobacter braakii]